MSSETAGELVFAKTLRDGKTHVEIRIEPDPAEGQDPDTTLSYVFIIYWDGQRPRGHNGRKEGGVFQASPYTLEKAPEPGITHAIDVPGRNSVAWVTIGLTAVEATQITGGKDTWIQACKDRKAACVQSSVPSRTNSSSPRM